jgi:hypothetical protein
MQAVALNDRGDVGVYVAVRLGPREDRFAFAGYFTESASTTARSATFTASELPKRATSSGSTMATAKDRRAFSAYLPRGSRLALGEVDLGDLLQRALGRFSLLRHGSPFALRGSSGTDDPDDTARRAFDAHHFAHHLGVTAWTPRYPLATISSGKVRSVPSSNAHRHFDTVRGTHGKRPRREQAAALKGLRGLASPSAGLAFGQVARFRSGREKRGYTRPENTLPARRC